MRAIEETEARMMVSVLNRKLEQLEGINAHWHGYQDLQNANNDFPRRDINSIEVESRACQARI